MKLLYIITSTSVGGAEKALLSLVKSVARKHTVRIVSLKEKGPVAHELEIAGAEVISLNMTGSGLGCVKRLSQEIDSFKPDIVHALLFRAIEFSRLACAGKKVKLISTPHFDLSQKPFWMRLLDRTLKSLDSVTTAESVSTYNYLVHHQYYPPKKTLLIANSVEKSLFFKDNSIKTRMRQKNGFQPGDIIFISVARLAPVKNLLHTVQSFAKILPSCPQAKLVLVGEGEERKKLEAFLEEKRLKNNIFLVGYQQNINDWLNLADVFVLLSKEESLPLSLLEAQQVGLPCIVSGVGDMPKRVTHGKDGYICNFRDEIIATCLMAELCENKDLREKMGKIALEKSAGNKDVVKQYQHLYQQLAGL